MIRAGAIFLLATVLAAAAVGLTSAQDASLSVQVPSVTDAGYPKAQAILTVEDSSSEQPPALTKDDINVTVAGAAAPVLDAKLASSETTPLDVLFLIDVSGSMAGQPLASVKQAAKGFIGQLAPQDRVGIMTFSNQVQLAQDYTTDHAAAAGVVDRLTAGGNTALYLATAGAEVKAATSPASRRAIVLLSDGADYGTDGSTPRSQAVLAATNVGVPVFAIGEGTDIDRAYLQDIANASKGRYLEAPDPKQLVDLYAGIARLLRSQYVVTFDASSIKQAGDVPVEVTIKAGARSARASTTYHAPTPAATTLSVSGIGDGASVTSRTEISAQVASGPPPSKVTFRVDGKDVAAAEAAPYTFSYDPASYGNGAHTLEVIADTPAGPVTSKVAFSSKAPAAAGGFPMIAVGAIVVVLALAAGGAFFVLRARRQRKLPPAVAQIASVRRVPAVVPPPEPDPVLEPEVVEEPKGILISRSMPDLGAEYVVGSSPVSIGSGERCAVRVPDRGMSGVEARVWVRAGQLMLHRVTSLNALANDGVTGGWTILEPGDTFQIGPHEFEFRLLREHEPEIAGDVPNVLRDPERPLRVVPPSPQPQAAPSRLRLPELMPRDSITASPDVPQADEQAS